MSTITVSNELLLSLAVQTVSKGNTALIPVKGSSMHPFIIGERDSVELYPPVNLRKGDIVLARFGEGKYLLHRIYSFDGENGVILMGDGNVGISEHCSKSDILAKALYVVKKNGTRRQLNSLPMRIASNIWKILLPIRGILLKFYRVLILRYL